MSNELITDRCDGCRFWRRDEYATHSSHLDDVEGECRRFPPTLCDATVVESMEDMEEKATDAVRHDWVWLHPVTIGSEWCGEHKPK